MQPNGQDRSAAIRRERASEGLELGTAERPQVLVELLREWNVRAEPKPEIAPRSDLEPLSVRLHQRPTGLAEGYKKVCQRWSLESLSMAKLLHLEEEVALSELILSGQVPPITGDMKDRMALVIGISLGLGELFDDDKDAELQWLTSQRVSFGGISAMEHMLKGDLLNVKDVADLVEDARGLR